MAISEKLKEYLKSEQVNYELMEHPVAYTALEVAGAQHVPGKQMAKSVIVKADGNFIMCVLPAIHLIDFEKLKELLNISELTLAEESEVATLFPDYEVGAEPPFGHLYGLQVIADNLLQEGESITFNAGTHTDVIKIDFNDYKRLVNPKFAKIGTHI